MECNCSLHQKIRLVQKKLGRRIEIRENIAFNAGVTPDGRIVVTALLADFLDVDELGGVLSHELAHIRLGHPEDRKNRMLTSSKLHRDEFEADARAVDIAIESGFDPRGFFRALRMLARIFPESEFTGSSTHPSFFDRLRRLGDVLTRKGYSVFA